MYTHSYDHAFNINYMFPVEHICMQLSDKYLFLERSNRNIGCDKVIGIIHSAMIRNKDLQGERGHMMLQTTVTALFVSILTYHRSMECMKTTKSMCVLIHQLLSLQ